MSQFYDDELAALACGDGGCVIQRPRGMHTNGGCHCLATLEPYERARITKALWRYRQIVDVLANAKLIPKDEP